MRFESVYNKIMLKWKQKTQANAGKQMGWKTKKWEN